MSTAAKASVAGLSYACRWMARTRTGLTSVEQQAARERIVMSRMAFIAVACVVLGGMTSCAARNPSTSAGVSAPESPGAQPERQAPLLAPGKSLSYNFDQDPVGALPLKVHGALTCQGPASNWIVKSDPSAPSQPNVLAQMSQDKTDYRFPLAIADDASFENLELNVKFKAVSGDIDRAGGLVFRLK